MSVTVETAIDQALVLRTWLQNLFPFEPIQRFLNYCRKRRWAANTVETPTDHLIAHAKGPTL